MLRDGQFCFYGLEAIFTSKGITPNTTRPHAAKVWPAKLPTSRRNFYMIEIRRFRIVCTMVVQSHTKNSATYQFFSSLLVSTIYVHSLGHKQLGIVPVFRHVPLVPRASSSLHSEANSKILIPEMILCRRQQRTIHTSKNLRHTHLFTSVSCSTLLLA